MRLACDCLPTRFSLSFIPDPGLIKIFVVVQHWFPERVFAFLLDKQVLVNFGDGRHGVADLEQLVGFKGGLLEL